MLTLLSPVLILVSIVGNFIIDSIVILLITLIVFKKIDFTIYKKSILMVWFFGFLSDIIGNIYLIVISFMADSGYYYGDDIFRQISSGIYLATSHSPFDSGWGVSFIISGIVLASILIFVLDYFISFRNTNLTKKQKFSYAISIAVLTAPYTFLLPKELFY